MDQPTEPREITVDEAMAIAIQCLKDDHVRDAAALCRRVLEIAPGHPDALHYSGVLAYRDGRIDEAIALIEQSLQRAPGQPDWHSNLGIILQAKGDLEAAVVAFQRAVSLDPTHANAHNNLGVLLRVFGRHAEAETAYRTAIELNPDHADAYHNLAILLGLTDRPSEAVTAYCKALTLKPDYPEVRRVLALAYCRIGDRAKAVQVCEEWLKSSPGDPVALHTHAACSGRDVPARASDEYVRLVFDSFSTSFEAKLARLHYRAPSLVAAAVDASQLTPARALDVLDAGCGTGLCGPLVAPYARRLVGVDLSSGMLEHARAKHVYDELVEGELTEYLRAHPREFDLIVSADTLVYFGALDDVVAAAGSALRPGGVMIFTVEEAIEPADADGFAIQPHGRFTHGAAYVERLLAGVGLRATVGRDELRKESGLPVPGLVIRATKDAGAAAREAGVAASGIGARHG